MSEQRRVFFLILIMAAVALVTVGVTIFMLYGTAIDAQRARLIETAQSQARLIEAVARFDAIYSRDYPEGAEEATISQIVDAHSRHEGFSETGEFILARREGNNIVFLLSHRHLDFAQPEPVPLDSELAEPTRRALSGQSGTMVGLDYRGETVLAAYEPVAVLDLGIVAKLDMAEIQAPFIRASISVMGIAFVFIVLGIVLVRRVSSPMVRRLEEYSKGLEIKVEERTHELIAANKTLGQEIAVRKQKEEEIQHSYALQNSINSVLRLSQEDIHLDELLQRALDITLTNPWLTIESKGAIFLVEDEPDVLVMKAQHGLTTPHQAACARIPFGKCYCGQAALSGDLVFADKVNERHDIQYNGISPHGHYCVPIKSADRVLGVINLYIKEGHRRDEREVGFSNAMADVLAGIIERKRVEEELGKSREYTQSILDNSIDLIFTVKKDGTFHYFNKSLKPVTGYKEEELAGRSFLEYIVEDEKPGILKNWQEEAIKGIPGTYETKIIKADGHIADVFYSFSLLKEYDEVLVVLRDITERKQREEEIQHNYDIQNVINSVLRLQQEDINLDELLERALGIVLSIPWLTVESRGAIFLVEDEPDVLVMKAQRGLAKPLLTACARLPFGKCHCGKAAQSGEIEFADRLDKRHEITYKGISSHGHYCVPIKSAEKVLGVVNLYLKEGHRRDEREIEFLTALANALAGIIVRRRAEEQLSTLKDSLITATRLLSGKLDIEATLKETLATARRLTGARYGVVFSIREGKVVKFLQEGLTEEEAKAISPCPPSRGLIGALHTEKKIIRVRDIAKDPRSIGFPEGHPLMKSFLGAPILHGDEHLGNIYLTDKETGPEFTEQDEETIQHLAAHAGVAINNARLYERVRSFSQELEEKVRERTIELEQATQTAQAASQAKSDFLTSMSHELRTPLNAIIGFSEMLGERYFGELNEKQADYIDDILESGKHLLSLINDILDISKIEAGKMELELSEVKIKELLENSLIMIKEKALKHQINLDLQTAPDLKGLLITADERKLKQVMFNLLSNAAKFTPDGGAITVDGRKKAEELIISVTDSGIGIAPENQEKIFDEFYQIQGGRVGKTPGTGLGLSLTKRMVEQHGGRIWVESEGESKGSRFSFSLPIEERADKETR